MGVHGLWSSQSRAAEVALAKKRFEMSRFDLVQHLNQLETRKKHEVVDRWAISRTYSPTELFLSHLLRILCVKLLLETIARTEGVVLVFVS